MGLTKFSNMIWMKLSKPSYLKHLKSTKNVSQTQKNLLLKIISDNKNTKFGLKYNFKNIKNIDDYKEKVPISTYDDYKEYIENISNGEKNILTKEKILMLELSSGTTSSSKFIPYTKSLKKQFMNGVAAWIYDIYNSNNKLMKLKSYWSISPITNEKKYTKGGISIGFEDDGGYFGFIENLLFKNIFPVPAEIKFIKNIDNFRYLTLLFMMRNKDLGLISVWNPTFLSILLSHIDKWKFQIINDIGSGKITLPVKGVENNKILEKLIKNNKKNNKRFFDLKDIFDNFANNYIEKLWPELTLISCWTDGNSSFYIDEIKVLFKKSVIQGKGLLATEGIVSFPLYESGGKNISVNSHFYEFIEEKTKEIKNINELEKGKIYSVVITTSGGLYRYNLQDLVIIDGFYNQCPLITFLGKEAKNSDYFGEKLNEGFVNQKLNELFEKENIVPSFYMVCPERDKEKFFYVLYLQSNEIKNFGVIADVLDFKFRENFHYDYCRKLNQIDKLKIFHVKGDGKKIYQERCVNEGQKIGDIKPSILHNKIGWKDIFPGNFI